jgi:CRISPR/Cas system-associated exonuclease Cas4 (RecB family)
MPSISTSEITTYMTCPRKHHMTYTERLARDYAETGPLRLGTVYHEIMSHVLQASYRSAKAGDVGNKNYDYIVQLIDWTARTWSEANRPEKYFEFDGVRTVDQEFIDRWNDTVETGKLLAELTVDQLDVWNRFEVLDTDELLPQYRPPGPAQPLVEYKIVFPIEGTDYTFNGVVDAVVRDRDTGHIVVLDWKTKSKFITEANELLNMQVGLYQYVLQAMGMNVHRGLIYQIKSTIKRPEMNKPNKKTGETLMSRRMIPTTWKLYKATLLEKGLDPEKYSDMRDVLLEKEKEMFRPLSVYRSSVYLINLWANVRLHVQQISADENHAMALGFACYNCPFNEICRARLEGWPVDEIIEANYVRLPPREVFATIIEEEQE